jgi:VanZ family protein
VLLLLSRLSGWTCVVALIVLSLVPGNERPHTGFPGQIEHLAAYCGTSGLLALGYPTVRGRFGAVAMLVLLAATLEVMQQWVPGRHSQFIDFAASSAGACLGMLVLWMATTMHTRAKAASGSRRA